MNLYRVGIKGDFEGTGRYGFRFLIVSAYDSQDALDLSKKYRERLEKYFMVDFRFIGAMNYLYEYHDDLSVWTEFENTFIRILYKDLPKFNPELVI